MGRKKKAEEAPVEETAVEQPEGVEEHPRNRRKRLAEGEVKMTAEEAEAVEE